MKNKKKQKKSIRSSIWHFMEISTSRASSLYHIFIALMITSSSMLAIWELTIPTILDGFHKPVFYFERFILVLFTVEFLIRLFCAPNLVKFAKDKYNWVDLLVIVPFYFHIESSMILRCLRILRLARLWKSFARAHLFEMIHLKGGIIEKVTPFVLILLFFKYVVVTLEYAGLWIGDVDLDMLFTIIGFALGIILSQKIAISYGKFRQLEDAFSRLHGKLSSIIIYMDGMKEGGEGTKTGYYWLENFLKLYEGRAHGSVRQVVQNNQEFYKRMKGLGNTELIPHHRMCAMLEQMFSEAVFILSWKSNYTPQAFDRLLLQVIVMYLIMVVIFVAGFAGVISTIIAGYLLYGMYYVTKEMDLQAYEGKESIIRLEPMRLSNYLGMLKTDLLRLDGAKKGAKA